MEDINNQVSTTETIEQKLLQPRLIIQAIAFTAILIFLCRTDTAKSL